jgi:AcrR family transcriptional regulator
VIKRGFGALSTAAVGEAAHEHGSLIYYYFGNKAGLVESLVDSLVEEPDLVVRHTVDAVGDPRQKVVRLLQEQEHIASRRADLRLFYELLPHILRSGPLSRRLAREYSAARQYDADVLRLEVGVTPDQAKGLGAIALAVMEGLGLHATLDPDDLDVAATYEVFRDMVDVYLADLEARSSAAGP